MTDLTPYSVVRDARGHLRLVDDGYLTYMGEPMAASDEARSLPVTPILDRDGLPAVLPDLMARAWDEGFKVGVRSGYRDALPVRPENPYRPTEGDPS